jgi:hypothetical protein
MRVALWSARDTSARSRETYDRFVELAARDEVGRHTVVDDPARADVLLVVDLHAFGPAEFPSALRELPAKHSQIRVYDERDEGIYTYAGLYVSPRERLMNRNRQRAVPYATTPMTADGFVEAAPDLLFSFQGSAGNHPVRRALCDALSAHPRGLVEDTTHISFHRDSYTPSEEEERDAARAKYRQALERSKFVLCPRGYGPSSFRIYETLAAGRVPVIISDEWTPPAGIDWASCSIRIPEASIAQVPTILETSEPEWDQLTAAARRAHESSLAPSRLWNYLIDELEKVRPSPSLRPWWGDRTIIRRRARSLLRRP